MANSQELLAHGKKTIDKIKKLITDKKYEEAYKVIDESPQPVEWVIQGEGVSGSSYNYNQIGLIESLTKELFGRYTKAINSVIISGDKRGCFAVTTHIIVTLKDFGVNDRTKDYHGIATCTVNKMEFLALETPRAVSIAFKNAMAQLGSFFGRDLNRNDEDKPPVINQQNNEAAQWSEQLEELKKKLSKFKTQEEAWEFIANNHPDWKLNVEIKTIINQKPSKK